MKISKIIGIGAIVGLILFIIASTGCVNNQDAQGWKYTFIQPTDRGNLTISANLPIYPESSEQTPERAWTVSLIHNHDGTFSGLYMLEAKGITPKEARIEARDENGKVARIDELRAVTKDIDLQDIQREGETIYAVQEGFSGFINVRIIANDTQSKSLEDSKYSLPDEPFEVLIYGKI